MYLEHVNITVKSIDECVRFLKTACSNFEIRGRGIDDGKPWAHVGTAETYIALNELPESASADGPLNHLRFVVDDVDTLAGRLQEAGYREDFIAPPHPHRKRRYFLDADDIQWEFVEYLSDDPAERNDYSILMDADKRRQIALYRLPALTAGTDLRRPVRMRFDPNLSAKLVNSGTV